jgi:hypothetical protein
MPKAINAPLYFDKRPYDENTEQPTSNERRNMKQWLVMLGWLIIGVGVQAQTLAPMPEDQQLLVWQSPRNGDAGQLMLLTEDINIPVLSLPNTVTDVSLCGINPVSQDGRFVAFKVVDGNQTNLYQMTDANPRISTLNTNLNAMTCVGDGVQYSPDNLHVGYLMWGSPAESAITLAARLLIHDTATTNIKANYENVADFIMMDGGAAYVTLFKNTANDYVEAGINTWDGSSTREITTLFTDQTQGCVYTSTSINTLSDGRLVVTLGVRCTRGETRTQYQIYTVDTETRQSSLLLQGLANGQFFAYTRTNNIYTSPNGQAVFQVLPGNFSNDTGVLISTALDAPAERVVIPDYVQMPQLSKLAPNDIPQLSDNGQWLALVVNTPDRIATLNAIDLDAPNVPPIAVPSNNAGDAFTNLLFTDDNQQLFYLAGNTENNAAFSVDLVTGISNRVGRGRYIPNSAVMSPFASLVAVTDSRTYSDAEPRYDMVVTIDLATGAQTDLFAGADIVDGKVTNDSMLVPIAWRRPG